LFNNAQVAPPDAVCALSCLAYCACDDDTGTVTSTANIVGVHVTADIVTDNVSATGDNNAAAGDAVNTVTAAGLGMRDGTSPMSMGNLDEELGHLHEMQRKGKDYRGREGDEEGPSSEFEQGATSL
jgi:hypothetical protein